MNAAGSTERPNDLRQEVVELRATVELLELQRDRIRRRRLNQLLLGVASLSLLFHIILIIILASIFRPGGGGSGSEPVNIEVAILQEEQLTELGALQFDDVESAPVDAQDNDPAVDLEADAVAAELEPVAVGAMPALGGAGAATAGDGSLGGAGAATSFFGISSSGTRFAYIVDRSGSMGNDRKLRTAINQLTQSIRALPDYASVYIVLFSDELIVPRMQRGWTLARPAKIGRLITWLNEEVSPQGGTHPRDAFKDVFSLGVRPDVIFFLTDGCIEDFTIEEIEAFIRSGKPVVINTVAFGDDCAVDLLRDMANRTGGVYRAVRTGGDR